MADPLTRPLTDNRMLRAVGGADLTVGMGDSLGAVFETPMMGGLAKQTYERSGQWREGLTNEQMIELRDSEIARAAEVKEIVSNINSLPDGPDRDAAYDRLSEIGRERETALSWQMERSVEAGRMVSQKDLAEEYGELGLSFDRPMTREEAKMLVDGKKAEIIRNALIEKGPQGALPAAARFGTGLLAMATDPLEVASTFIPVVGQVGKVAAVARFGRVGGRAAVGVVEGGVGAALTEPIYGLLSKQNQLDYSMNEALLNIGLGALLGGGIGSAAGVLSRGDAPSVRDLPERQELDIGHQREVADVALRQFVNGETINIARMYDGTDLRSSTTLSRVGPIEFQASQILPEPIQREIRPTYVAVTPEGEPVVFPTVQAADSYAAQVSGTVEQIDNGFVVRQVTEGDVVRDPRGKPLAFRTEQEAQAFASSPQMAGGRVFPLADGKFAIARGMSDEEFRAMQTPGGRIPDGVNTREIAVLPGADAKIGQAVRGVVARKRIAADFARQAQDISSDPTADIQFAERTTERNDAQPTLDEEIALMEQEIAQVELSAEARAEIDEIQAIEEKTNVFAEVAEAAAICLRRTA